MQSINNDLEIFLAVVIWKKNWKIIQTPRSILPSIISSPFIVNHLSVVQSQNTPSIFIPGLYLPFSPTLSCYCKINISSLLFPPLSKTSTSLKTVCECRKEQCSVNNDNSTMLIKLHDNFQLLGSIIVIMFISRLFESHSQC